MGNVIKNLKKLSQENLECLDLFPFGCHKANIVSAKYLIDTKVQEMQLFTIQICDISSNSGGNVAFIFE